MNHDSTNPKTLRWIIVSIGLVIQFVLIGIAIKGAIPHDEVREIPDYSPWSEEVVEVASGIPVQEGGRVKPFSTYARFMMLSFHGDLTLEVKSGDTVHKIGPTEWLLDCLFRPELADKLPIFRLDDTDVVKPFGVKTEKRRDRISMTDLMEGGDANRNGFEQLIDRGRELMEKLQEKKKENFNEEEKREQKIVEFAQLALSYRGFTDSLDLLRGGLPPIDASKLTYLTPEVTEALKSVAEPTEFLFWMPVYRQLMSSLQEMPLEENGRLPVEYGAFVYEFNRQFEFSKFGMFWLPPGDDKEEAWTTVGRMIEPALQGGVQDPERLMDDYRSLQSVVEEARRPNSSEFLKALTVFKNTQRDRAAERDEGGVIDSEISYYDRNYFMKALVYLLIAFVISAIGWMLMEGLAGKVVFWSTVVFYVVGAVYVSLGIAHRIYLTGRPPVSNLYDTIPFITAVAVIVLGLAELLTRRRLLLSMGAAIGVIGLFFAFRFEMGDAKDNMDPLRAVLDSNYWLATHVVSISIGYSGGLIACFLSTVYVFLALAGVMKDPESFKRFMTRAVYGIVCFTLLFSLVGTVLGGIWANDSWGRFWGWDPKENGALLIVLWCLIILHARLAGWIKDWGIHLLSIFMGSVVVFSWWGVNMLEVGLHSYGFIEGANSVYLFYGSTVAAMLICAAAWGVESYQKGQKKLQKALKGGHSEQE